MCIHPAGEWRNVADERAQRELRTVRVCQSVEMNQQIRRRSARR